MSDLSGPNTDGSVNALASRSARQMVAEMEAFFASGRTLPEAFRRRAMQMLHEALERRETEILDALFRDLGKPAREAYVSEIGFVLSDIAHALRRLHRWMRPQRRRIPLVAWPGRAWIHPEPLGKVLIIGPWNYPLQLLLSPLAGAMAAGNCACLKPSELAPHTSRLVAEMMRDLFPPEYIHVVEGGADAAQDLISCGFDHVFFTGGTEAGRKVMEAAARHLTPVTLELGGKNPCIVRADCDLNLAARRILWGKCINAGQTCVAPDHVLVEERAMPELLDALRETLRDFYPDSPERSPDYGRIVNDRHFARLLGYLDQGRIFCGGTHSAGERFLAPTILTDIPPGASVMQEEIFGPILPVIPFQDYSRVLESLRQAPRPLALYLFTNERAIQDKTVRESVSGGVCINDTLTHILCRDLPFGGIGASGMGAYHGKAGFDCFTHPKSILRRSAGFDPGFRYPPVRASLARIRQAFRYIMRG